MKPQPDRHVCGVGFRDGDHCYEQEMTLIVIKGDRVTRSILRVYVCTECAKL